MIFRSIGIWLCGWIYPIIPRIYAIFYSLSSAKFFNDEDSILDELSSNIYVLVSVVMLFIFSATFLSAIINPDIINDKKKGIGAMLKRAFIGIILIILIPFCFDEAYKIQNSVIDNHLVEKILVGIDYSDADTTTPGGNGGQVIAGTLLGSVLYPREDGIEVADDIGDLYSDMITKDIDNIDEFGDYINIAPAGNTTYKTAFEFQGLVAIIAGVGACYILLLFAMDMAVRLFTLAFYELTAPISVVAYMAIGDDQLKRWLSAVGKTLVDVYVRIAAMAFYIFLLSRLNSFLEGAEFQSVEWVGLLRVLLVIGMLIFVKKVPDLINSAFGFKIESKGGIGGRLGSMALAGGIAKKAWDKTKGALGRVATAPAALAGAGIGYGLGKLWNGTKNGKFQGLKNTKVGNALGHAGAYVGGGVKGAKKYHENSDYSKRAAANRELQRKQKAGENFRNMVNGSSEDEKALIDDEGNVMNKRGIATQNALKDSLKNDKNIDKNQRAATEGLMSAKSEQAAIEQMMKSREDIASALTAARDRSGMNQTQRDKLQELTRKFKSGGISNADFMNNLKELAKDGTLTGEDVKGIAGNLDKMNNTMNNTNVKVVDENGHVVGEKLMKDVITSEKGGFDRLKLTELKDKAADRVESAKSKYDKQVEVASESQKEAMERYVKTSEAADKRATWERMTYANVEEARAGGYSDDAKGTVYKTEMESYISSISSSGGSSGTGGSSGSSGSSSGGSSSGSSGSSSGGSSSGSSSGSSGSSSGGSSSGSSSGGSSSSSSSQDYSDDDIMDMMANAQIADAEARQIQQNATQQSDETGDFYDDIFDAQRGDDSTQVEDNSSPLFHNEEYEKIVNAAKNGTTSGTSGSSTYDVKQTENGTEITFHTVQGNDNTIIVDDQGHQIGNVDPDGKVTMIPNTDGTPRQQNNSSSNPLADSDDPFHDMMDIFDDEE